MAWDFSTEPEFEAKLDWMRAFVRTELSLGPGNFGADDFFTKAFRVLGG